MIKNYEEAKKYLEKKEQKMYQEMKNMLSDKEWKMIEKNAIKQAKEREKVALKIAEEEEKVLAYLREKIGEVTMDSLKKYLAEMHHPASETSGYPSEV